MATFTWQEEDFALGEVPHFLGTQALAVFAPTADLYTLTRTVATPSVRCMLASTSGAVPYWWVSAEVQFQLVFSQDGSDPGYLAPSDPRILHSTQLTPYLQYSPTAGAYSVVWRVDPTEINRENQRKVVAAGASPAAVYAEMNALDQHGVFAVGTNVAVKAFAFNLNIRTLWRSDF
jgi:hypothetical protein